MFIQTALMLYFSLLCWNVSSHSFQAAEAQETLEKESLAKVESEVGEELAQTLKGDDVSKLSCFYLI